MINREVEDDSMEELLKRIRKCEVCKDHLPLGPRPIVQLSAFSKILITSQAPGRHVHETGIPWNDISGKRLKEWMSVGDDLFYNPLVFSIAPMGFCYPGKGKSGDLPPRPECAPLWHPQIFKRFVNKPLVLLIGQYAQKYYLKENCGSNLTETVRNYRQYLPDYFPLPHPSMRNQYWIKINPWFAEEVIPELRKRIKNLIQSNQKKIN